MVVLLSFGVLPDGGLEALQVTVDRVGGVAAVGQGCDHKVGAVDVVAAGEHAAAAGAVVVADSNQVAALVRVQAGRRLLQQVVGDLRSAPLTLSPPANTPRRLVLWSSRTRIRWLRLSVCRPGVVSSSRSSAL